jgi:hypothetical protein
MGAFRTAVSWSLPRSVLAGFFTFVGLFMFALLSAPPDHADPAWYAFLAAGAGFWVALPLFVAGAVYRFARPARASQDEFLIQDGNR